MQSIKPKIWRSYGCATIRLQSFRRRLAAWKRWKCSICATTRSSNCLPKLVNLRLFPSFWFRAITWKSFRMVSGVLSWVNWFLFFRNWKPQPVDSIGCAKQRAPSVAGQYGQIDKPEATCHSLQSVGCNSIVICQFDSTRWTDCWKQQTEGIARRNFGRTFQFEDNQLESQSVDGISARWIKAVWVGSQREHGTQLHFFDSVWHFCKLNSSDQVELQRESVNNSAFGYVLLLLLSCSFSDF